MSPSSVQSVMGLIPARAGSTTNGSIVLDEGWAHPRPCGEHLKTLAPALKDQGSSPPVRGAPGECRAGSCRLGLIPARAGSTTSSKLRRFAGRAHPRPCGEHSLSDRAVCAQ